MVVFPQLNNGAGAQYPAVRRRKVRAAENRMMDGASVVYADAAFASDAWDLSYRDISDSECVAITSLFEAVEGRNGTFTFVDPTANLLAYSEDVSRPCWEKGPMVQAAAGIDDPLGGRTALRLTNASQTAQTVAQALAGPAWFQYSFSAYLRCAGPAKVTLSRSSGGTSHARVYPIGPGWTRCVLSGALNSTGTSVRFGMEIPAATAVDAFGLQAESGPCASAYRRTGARSGVYENARFDDDVFRVISDGPDQHRFHLRIVARD